MEYIQNFFNHSTAYQRFTEYHPLVYDSNGVMITWDGVTILCALLFIGIATTWARNRHMRAELRARKKLDCSRRRFDCIIEDLYLTFISDAFTKAKLKARHAKRLTNGSGKLPPDERPSDVQQFFDSLKA